MYFYFYIFITCEKFLTPTIFNEFSRFMIRGVQKDSIRFSIRYWPPSNVEYSTFDYAADRFEKIRSDK